MHRFKAYPQLKSVKVIVEERRIDLEMNPGNWRTHEYKGFQSLPDRLLPAFASPGTQAEVDLIALVQEVCESGKIENRFELPYQDGAGGDKKTVLRTVTVYLYHAKPASAIAGYSQRLPTVSMPLLGNDLWPRFEIQEVERALARHYSKLSATAIELVVRLAKLDLPPASGRQKLLSHCQWLLQRGRPAAAGQVEDAISCSLLD